jgi:hypothetical protein
MWAHTECQKSRGFVQIFNTAAAAAAAEGAAAAAAAAAVRVLEAESNLGYRLGGLGFESC